MKSLTILTFWILLILPLFANAQELPENFPQLEAVYKHLNAQMNFPCDNCYYELAKKMDGYYLVVVTYDDTKHDKVEYVKLWDAATKKYLAIDLDKYSNLQTMDENVSFGHEGIKQKQGNCDFNYLYDYENYTTDLIKYLESKNSLKNNELEMLARAYSTEATNFIHPNISGTIISESKNLPTPDYEKVAPERINSFIKLAEKSLSYYEQIKKNDPDYKPRLIEDIGLKINEDLMHYYQTLIVVKEPLLAQSFLDRVLFSESETAAAKAILDACETGSIYIPQGDNDSYPIWYVQAKLNYRKDVSVIHSVLLYTSWYFDYVKQTCPAKISLTLDEHKSISAGVVRIAESISEIPTYEEWIKELRSSMTKIEKPNYPEVPGVISFEEGAVSFTLYTESPYLTAVNIVIMDLIANNPNSKIYVSHPNVFEDFDLRGHFTFRGPIFEFNPAEEVSYTDEKTIEILKNNLTNPAMQFSVNSTPVDFWMFDSWGLTLAYAHSSDLPDYNELYELYKQKINLNELIKSNEQRSLNSYLSAIETTSSSDLDELLKLYTPTALKMLKDISETKPLTAKDVENISFIHNFFLPSIRGMDLSKKIPLTGTQKKVANELKLKVDRLVDLKVNRENLEWSLEFLESIQGLYDNYEL